MLRERASKADAAKSLNELRQEHDSIITLYLKQCLSLHGTIPVSGLDASTVSEVACRLYHLSASQQGTLEQNWRFLEIPLEYCPIQLRADESTSFERKAARQMLVSDTLHPFLDLEHVSEQRKTWTSRLLKAPYMPSMIKRDRFKLVDDTESGYCDEFKRALYNTSKQRRTLRRAGCLTVLSAFGELTADLCEMLVLALLDDSFLQNTCYRCIARVQTLKDEHALNKLFEYLNSDSMNTRFATSTLLIRLTQSAIVDRKTMQTALYQVIDDPKSNEELWLIEENDDTTPENSYYRAGKLKDVIYNLLVTFFISDASDETASNEFRSTNADLTEEESDFIASEKRARLAACSFDFVAKKQSAEEKSDTKSTSSDLTIAVTKTDELNHEIRDAFQNRHQQWKWFLFDSDDDSSSDRHIRNEQDQEIKILQTPTNNESLQTINDETIARDSLLPIPSIKESHQTESHTNKNVTELRKNQSQCCTIL
ncbi:unnamed protein product [Rotaria sp. Silwood1]|nr:unnamed protein product [Rotaria sp. Silwood1]